MSNVQEQVQKAVETTKEAAAKMTEQVSDFFQGNPFSTPVGRKIGVLCLIVFFIFPPCLSFYCFSSEELIQRVSRPLSDNTISPFILKRAFCIIINGRPRGKLYNNAYTNYFSGNYSAYSTQKRAMLKSRSSDLFLLSKVHMEVIILYFPSRFRFFDNLILEQATDASALATENWGLNMEICDFINSSEE